MPEEKRGRGRPRKKQPTLENEEVEKISMTEQQDELKNGNGVGKVRNAKDTTNKITLDAVQRRWTQVFKNYGHLGFNTVNQAYNRSINEFGRNPFIQNRRIKQINTPARDVSSDELKKALESPENSEELLRSVSMNLYYTNYIYQTLMQLNRNTPKYLYYANPLYVESKDKKTIKEDSKMVDMALKKFNPQLRFKTIANQVSIEGKCSYFVRLSYDKDNVNFFLLQKINSDRVKLTGFGSKQQFEASFNMALFLDPAYNVEQYPKFIREVWDNMQENKIVVRNNKTKQLELNFKANLPSGHMLECINDTYMYWVKLPQDLCYTFYSDGAHSNVFPDTIGLFNDLSDLDDYRWLQGNLLSKGVNSIITANVPIIKDPKAGSDATVISPDTILGYQDFFMENISANIFPFFAPFTDFTLHTLENQPESMDIIYSRIRDLIATSGNSALLPITDKPSIASVKAAEAIQASKNDYLTRQFQSFLNDVINENFNLHHKWNVELWGDIFYWRDDAKLTKEAILQGMEKLLPKFLSSQDMTLEDYNGCSVYLDALKIKIEKASDAELTNPVGRPKLADTDIENDNTATSNDLGNNVSDIKSYSDSEIGTHTCQHCGAELEDENDILCDSCLAEMYEERLS